MIARGGPGGASFLAGTGSSGATAKITVDHSNWFGGSTSGTNASIVEGGGNQSAAPIFALAGGYRQAAGSPTIDAGLDEAINGDFDIDGELRQIGGIDIGADEFNPAPAATTGPPGPVTDHSATLSGTVNPVGADTLYSFEYGPTTAYGSATAYADASAGGVVAVTATLSGLSPATTYHYRPVATNVRRVAKGADRTFTTAPPPAPTAPPPTQTSPPPAQTSTTQTSLSPFAGVKLVSTQADLPPRVHHAEAELPRRDGRSLLGAHQAHGQAAGELGRRTIGHAGPGAFLDRAGGQARVKVRVSRSGRRLLGRVRRLRGKDVNAARDGAGRSKTTVGAVTIRRRKR